MRLTALEKNHNKMEGLDIKYEGNKCWFHCLRCSYRNDKQYHAKMRFLRIHVNGGNSCERKRKYLSKLPSVAEYFRKWLKKAPTTVVMNKMEHKVRIMTEIVFWRLSHRDNNTMRCG